MQINRFFLIMMAGFWMPNKLSTRIYPNYFRSGCDKQFCRNSVENLTHLLGLEISKPFYLNGRPGKVVVQASPRALRPPFVSSGLPLTSGDLLGRSSTPPGDTWRHPRAEKTNSLDRKMPGMIEMAWKVRFAEITFPRLFVKTI